jgi:hypothetical protein
MCVIVWYGTYGCGRNHEKLENGEKCGSYHRREEDILAYGVGDLIVEL